MEDGVARLSSGNSHLAFFSRHLRQLRFAYALRLADCFLTALSCALVESGLSSASLL